jgi:CubicO group peptidase (beta-lactamase class C family)
MSNAPVTAGTAFRIASMTQSFTALAILKLRDEGKLSLEDPGLHTKPYLPAVCARSRSFSVQTYSKMSSFASKL